MSLLLSLLFSCCTLLFLRVVHKTNPFPLSSLFLCIHFQVVVGAVAGQVTLIGYMSLRKGLRQLPFLLPLPIIVLYLSSRQDSTGFRGEEGGVEGRGGGGAGLLFALGS